MERQEILNRFQRINILRQNNLFNNTRTFDQFIMFMNFHIKKQLRTFTLMSICGSDQKSKFMVNQQFQRTFCNLSLEQKLLFYQKIINMAVQLYNNPLQNIKNSKIKDFKEQIWIRIQIGFMRWKETLIKINRFKIKDDQAIDIDLRNYLLRKSKKKSRNCYVLQAINPSEPPIIRFQFLIEKQTTKNLNSLKQLIFQGFKQTLKRLMNITQKSNLDEKSIQKIQSKSILKRTPQQKQSKKHSSIKRRKPSKILQQTQQSTKNQLKIKQNSIVKQILKTPTKQNFQKQLSQFGLTNQFMNQNSTKIKQIKIYKNIFRIIFPFYQLDSLHHFGKYQTVYSNTNTRCVIFQNVLNTQVFKMEILFNIPIHLILQCFLNTPLLKNWHPEIVQSQIKVTFQSENSAILYQKHRSYSKWYRERDFLYVRHVFKYQHNYYFADKSIINTSYIPLQTIQRGNIIYQIGQFSKNLKQSKLILECLIQQGGLINASHAAQLTINYLKGFQKLQQYFANVSVLQLNHYYNNEWKIKENLANIHQQQNDFSQFSQIKSQDFVDNADNDSLIQIDDVFFSIKDQNQKNQQQQLNKSVHQIQQDQSVIKIHSIMKFQPEEIFTNQSGFIILPKKYLNARHPNNIIDKKYQLKRIMLYFHDLLKKNHWEQSKDGSFVLVNPQIIQAQDSVISYMIGTLRKNIFSGKGISGISLPVTIFNCDSYLSRYAYSFGLAPEFLEKAASQKSSVQRMKFCIIFGLTTSLLFFDIQKPFNPILGQTYQGFIAGCPFYAEQISHHPPISSILFYGKGYKVYANLQATVNIGLNSADGINVGWQHIIFDDGEQVCFQTPPAQFSGFTAGQRKFRLINSGYYYDIKNRLFAQMIFQDPSGIFSDNKWKHKDQFQAQIYQVSHQFLQKLVLKNIKKIQRPSKSQILKTYGKICGRWPSYAGWKNPDSQQQQKLYTVNKDLPYQLVDYQFPLHSNSNYRQDLYYRKKLNYSRSQSQKQRLQNIQRNDRQLRKKYNQK